MFHLSKHVYVKHAFCEAKVRWQRQRQVWRGTSSTVLTWCVDIVLVPVHTIPFYAATELMMQVKPVIAKVAVRHGDRAKQGCAIAPLLVLVCIHVIWVQTCLYACIENRCSYANTHCIYICLSVHLSHHHFCLFIYPSIYLSIYRSVYLSGYRYLSR